MKRYYSTLILTLLFACTLSAQSITEETVLEEVLINTKKKKKIIKHKISGTPAFDSFAQGEYIVTSIDKLPEGKITSVIFYFNTWFIDFVDFVSGEKFDTNYIDVELGLLVYEMTENRELGKLVSDCDIKFVVSHKHKGAYKIDLSTLDIPEDTFFIGFKVLSKTNQDEHNFYVRLFEDDRFISYNEVFFKDHSNPKNKIQQVVPAFANIKMTFEMEQ